VGLSKKILAVKINDESGLKSKFDELFFTYSPPAEICMSVLEGTTIFIRLALITLYPEVLLLKYIGYGIDANFIS
jgi:hypothetical protein